MRILNKKLFFVRLALFLASLLFVSCSPAPEAENISVQEEREKADTAFTSVSTLFFQDEMKKSSFQMHFYLSKEKREDIGTPMSIFTPVSLKYIQEDIAKAKEYQARLTDIDYFALTSEQQLLYDIMSEHLKARLMLEGIELYYEPLTPDTGIQSLLPIRFLEYEFMEVSDIDAYLAALEHIDTYFEEILAFEKEKAAFGSFMSDASYKLVLNNLNAYILLPNEHFLIQSFQDRMAAFKDSLSPEVYEDYIRKNQRYVEHDFHNAYTLLHNGLQEIKAGQMGIDANQKENQAKYLAYLLQTKTYTSLTDMDSLRPEIAGAVDTDIQALAKLLETNDRANIPSPISADADADILISDYIKLIESLRASASDAFPVPTQLPYKVKLLPDTISPALPEAFYFSSSLEQAKHILYINASKLQTLSPYGIVSLSAHEAVPGHILQWNHFISRDYPLLRKYLINPAFLEGWASYAEMLSANLYEAAESSSLHALAYQNKINTALYAYIDLSIHYFGATEEDIGAFLSSHAGIQDTAVIHTLYETVEANPTHYLTHYLGYREIAQMRQQAMDTLGEKYSDYDFHTWLLDMGPAPFHTIKKYFNIYLSLSK